LNKIYGNVPNTQIETKPKPKESSFLRLQIDKNCGVSDFDPPNQLTKTSLPWVVFRENDNGFYCVGHLSEF
jgi:hypothetical protein